MTAMDVRGSVDLTAHGITPTGRVLWNASTPVLYEHAITRGEARIAEGGPIAVDTGTHTGRSPQDKFVVREPSSEGRIWWDGNKEFSEDGYDHLREKVTDFLGDEASLYVVDAFAGADPAHRIARARHHDAPVPRALRPHDVHRPERRGVAVVRAAGGRAPCSGARGGPGRGRHAQRHLHRPASRRAPRC